MLFACAPVSEKEKRPAEIIPEEEMAGILTDLHLAEALVTATPHQGDTNTQRLIDSYATIYLKHHTDEKSFKTSYDYYTHHPVLLDSVYSEVINRLSDRETQMRTK